MNWTLRVASVHGKEAPLPFVRSVEVNLFLWIHYAPDIIVSEAMCVSHWDYDRLPKSKGRKLPYAEVYWSLKKCWKL